MVVIDDDDVEVNGLSDLVSDWIASYAPGNSGASVMISISSNDDCILSSPMSYSSALSLLLQPYTSFTVEMP